VGCAHAQVLQNGLVVGREPAPVLLAGTLVTYRRDKFKLGLFVDS
jgi:hypothetical protein